MATNEELQLLLRNITDKDTRENFFRIIRYVDQEIILHADWRIYDLKFEAAATNFKTPHNRDFIPYDIIMLEVVGDRNVEFNHDKFDATNFDITVKGPCYIRFLAGRYDEDVFGLLPNNARQGLTNVPVGGGGGSGSPLAQVCQTMDCDASLAVNDWVYQSPTTSNRAVKTTSWTQVEPTIGIVKSKPSAVTAEVLLLGLYTGLALPAGRGRIFLGSSGTAVFTFPSSGTGRFVRQLGIAFGNGTIYVNPNVLALELDDG